MRSALAVSIGACSLALSACGGNSDKDRITAIIKAYGKDPAQLCRTYATPELIRQQFQTKANCLLGAQSFGAADPRVKVGTVSVKGSTAVAVRITETPPGVGMKSTLRFVKQGGLWRVAQIAAGGH